MIIWKQLQIKVQFFDTEYTDTALSIMEQAREKFLTSFKSTDYIKGVATVILSDILNENVSFVANTKKLYKEEII